MRLTNVKTGWMIILVLLTLLLPSCDKLSSKVDDLNENIDQHATNVEDILNNTIDNLSANANNWEGILRDTIDQIPDSERQVRIDIENLLNSSIGAAGVEFRCDVDFMGRRIIERIKGIKAVVLNQPIPERSPVICSLSPSAVDMNLDANNRNKVEIYGYNFDTQNISLYLKDGQTLRNVTTDIYKSSEYKMVINLGFNGVNLGEESTSLTLKHKNDSLMNIPVLQAYPKICKSYETSEELNNMQIYPEKYRGDSEWGGHGPCVSARLKLSTSPDKSTVFGELYARMWECNSNFTQRNDSIARGTKKSTLWTAPVGYKIDKINSLTSSSLRFYTGSSNHTHSNISGDALVGEWIIQGDTKGNDIGESNVEVNLNPVSIVLREDSNCVTEEELDELIKANQIEEGTVQKLFLAKPLIMKKFTPMKSTGSQ